MPNRDRYKHQVEKPGIHIDVGVVGVSETTREWEREIGPDFNDCTLAIEPCGDDVFELWIHSEERRSVCLLADAKAFQKLGRALCSLQDSRCLGSIGEVE